MADTLTIFVCDQLIARLPGVAVNAAAGGGVTCTAGGVTVTVRILMEDFVVWRADEVAARVRRGAGTLHVLADAVRAALGLSADVPVGPDPGTPVALTLPLEDVWAVLFMARQRVKRQRASAANRAARGAAPNQYGVRQAERLQRLVDRVTAELAARGLPATSREYDADEGGG